MANKLKDTAPFTADDLKNLVTTLEKYNNLMWDQAQRDGRLDYAIQYHEVIQTFIEGIYYVWERYGYGWADELADENGIDGIRYMLFQNGVEERVEGLLDAIRLQNIFEMFERGTETRNTLIKVYADLLRNLKLRKITF
jgi:hypothetical protein